MVHCVSPLDIAVAHQWRVLDMVWLILDRSVQPTPLEINTVQKEHCRFQLHNGEICNGGPFWPSQLVFHMR